MKKKSPATPAAPHAAARPASTDTPADAAPARRTRKGTAPATKAAAAAVAPAPVAAPAAGASSAKAAKAAKAVKAVKAAKPAATAQPAAAEPAPKAPPAKRAARPAVQAAVEAPARPAAEPAAQAAARRAAKAPAQPAVQPAAEATAKAPAKTAARKAAAGAAPARAPAAVPAPAALPIHQIYFLPGQRPGLDPAFIPLDNAGRDHPLREFAVFERLAAQPAQQRAPLWGALSWRFGQKTGLTGAALLQAIAARPGQDLYYCNPYPEHEALYINGWQQGVPSHPAFTELCAAVLKAAGLDDAELRAVQSSRDFSACNYFVGSPAFWGAYLPWVRGLIDRARAALPVAVLRVLDSPLSDPKGMHAGSTYWPFIVERLLPLFLRQAGRGLKVHKIALPAGEARLNIHLQRLREMKDMAHRSKSRWLYGCWLNYRNLYLLQTAGAAWCKRYLPKISATEFDFR